MIKDNYNKLVDWNDPFSIAYLKDGVPLEPGDACAERFGKDF